MAAGARRVIAGVNGSVRSLAALRAAVAEARLAGAELLAVHAWVPAGGELAYARAPCPYLLKVWEQAACDCLRAAFDEAFGGMPAGLEIRPVIVRSESARRWLHPRDQQHAGQHAHALADERQRHPGREQRGADRRAGQLVPHNHARQST